MSQPEREIEVRAHAVKLGDWVLGLGRVQSITMTKRITLHSEGNDWRVDLDPHASVVVLRKEQSKS